jgi:hypothetical protein
MAFKKGDFIKIKDGILDVEESKYDLGGWQGHITAVTKEDGEVLYDVHWDSETMKRMPQGFIQKNVSEELSLSEYSIEEGDAVASKRTETLKESQAFADEFEDYNMLNDGSNEGTIIMQVLDTTKEEDDYIDNWLLYLNENVTFPLVCQVLNTLKGGPKVNTEVVVTGLFEEIQELYGIMAILQNGYQIPLSFLEVAEKATDNWIYLEAYGVWFLNVES